MTFGFTICSGIPKLKLISHAAARSTKPKTKQEKINTKNKKPRAISLNGHAAGSVIHFDLLHQS